MFEPIHHKTATLPLPNSISQSPLRRGLCLITLALVCFGISPASRAVTPPPDGDYGNGNTAEGGNALFSLTTGSNNTAIGASALFSNTNGISNTATGVQALFNNTTGFNNTANGASALVFNTNGQNNTATGAFALFNNKTASFNTAIGSGALFSNRTGSFNTANGASALSCNITGGENTANGFEALVRNTTGDNNTANGFNALFNNTTGSFNTAEGFRALENSTGSSNTALGSNAGINLTTGSNNIDIGAGVVGAASDANTIRIGTGRQTATFVAGIYGATVGSGVGVVIDVNGHLGTVTSSERFKDEIKPMDKASEAILALQPVTFRYKHELDPEGIPQFGLVAEQVEKVNPDLVARDAEGKVNTVRYEAVNAMLLNEFLKEHRKVEEQEKTIAELKSGMETLTATVKEQAAQIQKVSDDLEVSRRAPQLVLND